MLGVWVRVWGEGGLKGFEQGKCERKVLEHCFAMNTCSRANVLTYFIFSECVDIV